MQLIRNTKGNLLCTFENLMANSLTQTGVALPIVLPSESPVVLLIVLAIVLPIALPTVLPLACSIAPFGAVLFVLSDTSHAWPQFVV